ncbi:MAG: DUF4178 domain-containing protein [Silicimonas sp.]|nr:DUF4178 domain-containing protein [Silicimonas sp.]
MSTAQAVSFNCTQCGAGLDALGGGRVQTHVCPYCGAELDAQDGYKVLARFRDMERPETPFDIGMTGTLWDVPFTVIGTIGWVEYHAGRKWEWVDHQLFSPTHGYGWLTVEDGHVSYARKSRRVPSPAGVSDYLIETSENRPRVKLDGQSFVYYGSGVAKPFFIEGEFNYRPTLEDTVRYVSLAGDGAMLDIVEGGGEREYELVQLPDQAALLTSFGVPKGRWPKPRGVHPLEPLRRSPLQLFARNLFLGASALTFVLALILSTFGQTVGRSDEVSVWWGAKVPFEITQGNRLTEIEIWGNADNSWAWFEAELLDEEDEPVAVFERGIEYYTGSDWSEGSQRVRTRLRLPPGRYSLEVGMTEAEVDWTGGNKTSRMRVSVTEGVVSTFWLWWTAVLLGLAGAVFLAHRVYHYSRLMSGSDWSDD